MRLEELRRKSLEAAKRLSEDEKKLIKEIVESSPNSIVYMGYIPVHFRYRKRAVATIVAELLLIAVAFAAAYLLYDAVVEDLLDKVKAALLSFLSNL